MQLFSSAKSIASIEHKLGALQGMARLNALIELAWYGRQLDCYRSMQLVEEADALLHQQVNCDTERSLLTGRLLLIQAEVKVLFCEYGSATQLLDSARAMFDRHQDAIGLGDAAWLDGMMHFDIGSIDDVLVRFSEALDWYRRSGDEERVAICVARLAVHRGFYGRSTPAAEQFEQISVASVSQPQIYTWQANAIGQREILIGGPAKAVVNFINAYEPALESGQIRHAITVAANVGCLFSRLGDLDAAAKWGEDTLKLARKTGWPACLGVCLISLGEVLLQLGQANEARAYLMEAREQMRPLSISRNFRLATYWVGKSYLLQDDLNAALAYFDQCEVPEVSKTDFFLASQVWCGQATVYIKLGDWTKASEKAHAALMLAEQHNYAEGKIAALSVLADLNALFILSEPPAGLEKRCPLGLIHQALDVANSIDGYSIKPDLMDQVAAFYSQQGDFKAAYESGLTAGLLRREKYARDVQNRVLTMEIRQQAERAKLEAQHQGALIATLQETADTLSALSRVGQEVTASLEIESVLQVLYQHVYQMLKPASFFLYLTQARNDLLTLALGIENGMAVERHSIAYPASTLVGRCASRGEEYTFRFSKRLDEAIQFPASGMPHSVLCFPLMSGERVLGVMCVHDVGINTFDTREQSIFRTLCAYGAIALDNSAAYAQAQSAEQQASKALRDLQQSRVDHANSLTTMLRSIEELKQEQALRAKALHEAKQALESKLAVLKQTELVLRATQDDMVQAGKLAMLGQMTVGITHEIGQPLTAIQNYADNAKVFISRDALLPAIENLTKISDACERMGSIMGRLKGMARKEQGPVGPVDLARSITIVAELMLPALTRQAIAMRTTRLRNIWVVGHAGSIEQVLVNLLRNAIDAVEHVDNRCISLSVEVESDCAYIRVRDNGPGIDAACQDRIFDPFFTTKPIGKGLGLGLAISQTIVEDMKGLLTAGNHAGGGAEFTVMLPLMDTGVLPSPAMADMA